MAPRADGQPSADQSAEDPIAPLSRAEADGRRLLVVMAASERQAGVITALATFGLPVETVESSGQAIEAIRRAMPDLVVVSEDPGGEPVAEVVAALRAEAPDMNILLWAAARDGGAGTVPVLREAERPPRAPGLSERARRPARNHAELDPFLGDSEEIRRLEHEARSALASESPVLIEGETGTGKGVLAAWLHRHGPRARQPFIDLNCAGFSRELMDSELFGHDRGAFTGAVSSKPGLLEVADGGTLFLDEIGDMDAPIQAKLLKVIEEKRFRRIGETRERLANVRVIAATHHDLSQLVREGRFREDLYYRIRVLSLRIPPLRAHAADLDLLVPAIANSIANDLGRPAPRLSAAARRVLAARSWPGNLRELRNTLERALLAAGDQPIRAGHLGREEGPSALPPDHPGGTLLEIERAYIERVLEEEENVTRAAQRLGMARSTLYQKLHALGITRRS